MNFAGQDGAGLFTNSPIYIFGISVVIPDLGLSDFPYTDPMSLVDVLAVLGVLFLSSGTMQMSSSEDDIDITFALVVEH